MEEILKDNEFNTFLRQLGDRFTHLSNPDTILIIFDIILHIGGNVKTAIVFSFPIDLSLYDKC